MTPKASLAQMNAHKKTIILVYVTLQYLFNYMYVFGLSHNSLQTRCNVTLCEFIDPDPSQKKN